MTIKEILDFLQFIAIVIAIIQLRQNGKSIKNESAVAQAEFALEFMKDYAKPEMSESLRLLRLCSDEYGIYLEDYGIHFSDIWIEKLHNNDPLAKQINQARRFVKFHYSSAYVLYKEKLITEKVFRMACFNSGINLLHDVAASLEDALDSERDKFFSEIKEELGHFPTQVRAVLPN